MTLALPQLLLLLAGPCLTLPRFEVYWESEDSFLYNDAEFQNPWYIDLGDINVGPPGYIGGPNVVTIHSADYCTFGCQENWPDEFCSNYPPEGVPAKPRTVEDWGTKFNITANMMRDGIDKIHAAGGKVNLAYGGRRMYMENGYFGLFGISAEVGGGGSTHYEDGPNAIALAERIVKNVEDWDLDGVDFFFTGPQNSVQYYPTTTIPNYSMPGPGGSVVYHYMAIKALRGLLPPGKTISYTTTHAVDFVNGEPYGHATLMETVIAACHPFLDSISFHAEKALDYQNLEAIEALGIPLSKLGAVFVKEGSEELLPSTVEMEAAVMTIKERGLAGLSVFSINQENNLFRGAWARMVAELLYL